MGPLGEGEKNAEARRTRRREERGDKKHAEAREARYCTVTAPSGTATSASLATTTLFPGFSGLPGHSGT